MDLLLQQIRNGLVLGSTDAVVAVGFALAFTVPRVIQFAHPDPFTIGMFSGMSAANVVPGGGRRGRSVARRAPGRAMGGGRAAAHPREP